MRLATEIRFYFGEDIGSLTLPVMLARKAFLYSDASGNTERGKGNATGEAMAAAAREMMSRSGRKTMPLGELMGVM